MHDHHLNEPARKSNSSGMVIISLTSSFSVIRVDGPAIKSGNGAYTHFRPFLEVRPLSLTLYEATLSQCIRVDIHLRGYGVRLVRSPIGISSLTCTSYLSPISRHFLITAGVEPQSYLYRFRYVHQGKNTFTHLMQLQTRCTCKNDLLQCNAA